MLAALARHAGVSTALVSYRFQGRDELMLEVIATPNERTEQAVTDDTDDVTALRELITLMIRYFGGRRSGVLAYGHIYTGAPTDSAAARSCAAVSGRFNSSGELGAVRLLR